MVETINEIMYEIINDIEKLDNVNIRLFKKLINNIDDNIKRSIEKSNYSKAANLKSYKLLLIKYIKEHKYVNNELYLKNILDKLKNLNMEISKTSNNEENDILIDVYISKFDNVYINLFFIFIYKFSKINQKALILLATDYLKKLYYTIQNSNLDNRYSNISLYDFIINNPNKDLEKFIIHIQQNKLENNLIKYSKKILKKLKNNNAITIKNINELQTEKMQQNNKSDYTLDNELNSLEKQLFYDNNIFSNLLYIIYKNILLKIILDLF